MNALTIVFVAICVFAIAYRFYGLFIGRRVLELKADRVTPAVTLADGHDYHKTNKYVLFGHHFAAIAAAGPLIGPVLAAQFGYLPGALWIIVGVVLGGAVQDFVILAASIRRDGKSLGRKKKGQYEYRLRWDDVVYRPGKLEVIAYKNGKRWATDVMKTTGPASKLLLQADRNRIRADGDDLSFVTVTVADSAGLMVPQSKNHLRFSIEGPGQIVATDNGDPTSFESFQAPERNAFNGLALVIVRGKAGQAGTIKLTAVSEDLKTGSVTIRTR